MAKKHSVTVIVICAIIVLTSKLSIAGDAPVIPGEIAQTAVDISLPAGTGTSLAALDYQESSGKLFGAVQTQFGAYTSTYRIVEIEQNTGVLRYISGELPRDDNAIFPPSQNPIFIDSSTDTAFIATRYMNPNLGYIDRTKYYKIDLSGKTKTTAFFLESPFMLLNEWHFISGQSGQIGGGSISVFQSPLSGGANQLFLVSDQQRTYKSVYKDSNKSFSISGPLVFAVAPFGDLAYVANEHGPVDETQTITPNGRLNIINLKTGKITYVDGGGYSYRSISFNKKTGKLYAIRECSDVNDIKKCSTKDAEFELNLKVFGEIDLSDNSFRKIYSFRTFESHPEMRFDNDTIVAATKSNDRLFVAGSFLGVGGFVQNGITSIDIATNRSWYVCSSMDSDFADLFKWMHDAGYVMGQRDWVGAAGQTYRTIFAFGAAKKSAGRFGATGYGRFISVAKIKAAVLKYAAGWAEAVRGNKGVKLEIVVGTSNNVPSQLTAAHGAAWAKLADDIKSALPTSYAAQIAVVGGIDIEAEWSPVAPVKDWLSGYGAHDLVNFGDLHRCYLPTSAPDCGSATDKKKTWTWTVADFIDVNRDARTIPEIYSKTQARQWAHFARDFKDATKKMLPIEAPLSQARICWQNGNKGCKGMNNSPEAAWQQLNGLLPASLNAGLGPTTDIADNPFKIPGSRHCPAPKPTGVADASEAPAPDFVGINPQPEGLDFPKGLYHTWSGKIDGHWRSVSAGYAFADPSQGVVVTDDPDKHILYPPEATGPLTIVSEHGGVLVLKGDGGVFENPVDADDDEIRYQTVRVTPGKTYRFDVRKGDFIN